MTSQSIARPWATDPISDALRRFFDRSDTPAALCDGDLVIVAANRAFGVRVGAQSEEALAGMPLSDLFETDPPLSAASPAEGLPAFLPGGRPALVNVGPAGELQLVTLDAGLEGARLAHAHRALEAQGRVFSIGRLMSLLLEEEDLVGVVAEGIREIFGDRSFCIRIVDPATLRLTSLYAEGSLLPEARERLTIKRSAVARTRLPPETLESERLVVRDGYHRIFEGSETGIGVPLVAANRIFGMLNVEGGLAQFDDADDDERLLIMLANQLSVALRNAKLLADGEYLREYLEKLIDNANALIAVGDRDGRVTVFNRACQELSGFARDEVLGRPLVDLVIPEERAQVSRLVAMAFRGQSAANIEVTVQGRAGRRSKAAFNTASVMGADGEVESVVFIGHDLTRLVELERQVLQAEKLASLGQFAAAVVHELNNPLTSIMVYAEYLKDRMEAVGVARDVEKAARILESADRILTFTRNLVAYARPAEERTMRLDLWALVEESVRLCEHVVNECKVKVVQDVERPLPPLEGNRGKLQQVFVNLVTNACHAMVPGGTLTLSGRLAEAGFIELRVADDGHGMARDVADRVFEPFFSTKPPGKGTGLGLSIVQGIVQAHGGTIGVESVAGHGTTFTIRLPTEQAG